MAKTKVEYNQAAHGDMIKSMIKECSNHKAIIEGANDAIKEIRKRAQDEFGFEPKQFNKLLSMYHKDSREAFENESEETLEAYDALFTN
ncbi:transcriptional regulator [Acinetobacter phage ZZ1]|jgi:hypothetical protein|uniref:Late transcription dsDNA binding protein n=3 Tax=Caudoviricetes TaxID=2731619 RepID=A0A410T570_9CAUD|nr:transcriptional regulator [Acinetobacter phage ZZ1]AFL47676.1 late transcription dsDNA binding protein [Acinetobacter phage ZZ1]QAU03890.1 late transcription dsDNA binding protein [Acinetobacter phage Henu6]